MEVINLIQWPAAMLTLVGAWLVGSKRTDRRRAGFWVYLASNAVWAAWGHFTGAYAVVMLQAVLAGLNVRGMRKACSPAPS